MEAWRPVWLSLSDEELKVFPPPPRNHSAEMQAEITTLLNLQRARTAEQAEQILTEVGVCGWNLAGFQMGMSKPMDDFLVDIFYDAILVGFKLKTRFDRVRPSYYDRRIDPAIPVPEHASYPSNHAVETHTLALVLSDIYPEKRQVLLDAAGRIAGNREIAGVHYPSDTRLGKAIAAYLHTRLEGDARYRDRVRSLRSTQDKTRVFSSFSIDRMPRCEGFIRQFRENAGLKVHR